MASACRTSTSELARLDRVTVRFGATLALRECSQRFFRGEVHALVGENGAGKSTALRVLAGLLSPDSGSVDMAAGTRVGWAGQELDLPEDLTIGEWLFLAREVTRWGFLRRRSMCAEAEGALARFGLSLSPQTRIAALSLTERKIVQLLRALQGSPDLLLLDEPTAVLGDEHTQRLFSIVQELRARGRAIVYVTHRLAEVLAIADRISVLRDGQVVWSGDREEADQPRLLALMAGSLTEERPSERPSNTAPALEVRSLACGRVRGFSLTVAQGEIVGLAGLAGSGRSTIIECLAGRIPRRSGWVTAREPVALVPEDRRKKGLAFDLCVRENLFLVPAACWIRRAQERIATLAWFERLAIRASGTEVPVSTLSGGNQQKLLLARALQRRPAVLLADEPTAGVDVATKAALHRFLREQARLGMAVVVSSSEVSELLALCHRVVALYNGQRVAEAMTSQVTETEVVAWITGATAQSPGP